MQVCESTKPRDSRLNVHTNQTLCSHSVMAPLIFFSNQTPLYVSFLLISLLLLLFCFVFLIHYSKIRAHSVEKNCCLVSSQAMALVHLAIL